MDMRSPLFEISPQLASKMAVVQRDWNTRLRDELERGKALSREIQAQDATITRLERNLTIAEDEARKSKDALDEKAQALNFVESEVRQLQSMFSTRERELKDGRDKARAQVCSSSLGLDNGIQGLNFLTCIPLLRTALTKFRQGNWKKQPSL